jgi:hypothetical protein
VDTLSGRQIPIAHPEGVDTSVILLAGTPITAGTPMDERRQYLEELRQIHQRRLQALQKQEAALGVRTPAEITTEITDILATVAGLDKQLGSITSLILPPPVADFIGREREIDQLVQMVNHAVEKGAVAVISGVRGMGGIGKTELALSAAQRLAQNFPDGQVLIELRGGSQTPLPSELALQTVIRTLEPLTHLSDDLVELKIVYQQILTGKHVLILADDARDASQVRPLLPPAGCALLITSRQRFTLPGMTALDLETLSPEEAEQLLRDICPRIGNHASQLAQLCGYLPLALRVSAGVLANDDARSVERYIQQITDHRQRLKGLRDPDDPVLDVEATLKLSYYSLDTAAQDALVQLAGISATFDLSEALAVVKPKGNLTVEELLGALRRRCLIDWNDTTRQYGLHDLVRAFAATHGTFIQEVDPRPSEVQSRPSEDFEFDLQQQRKLLDTHRRTLAHLLKQKAQFGAYTPAHIENGIYEARENIRQIKAQLEQRGIRVEDNSSEDLATSNSETPQTLTQQAFRWRSILKACWNLFIRVFTVQRPLVAKKSAKDERQVISLDDDSLEMQKRFLKVRREALGMYLMQEASFGLYTPPHVANALYDTRIAIRQIKATLRDAGVDVKDYPGEELTEYEQEQQLERVVHWPAVVVTVTVIVSIIAVLFLIAY